jgi:DUF2075 family protein
MTDFRIERLQFNHAAVGVWGQRNHQHRDWPVVYTLNNSDEVYVGESLDAGGRLRQHLDQRKKSQLIEARVIIDETFNKSACLDLESYLIQLFHGDGRQVLNGNAGVVDGSYFQRERYRKRFREIFDRLRAEGLFEATIEEIENSDLFKLSPFKSLTEQQGDAVVSIIQGLLADLRGDPGTGTVIEGGPGTGKTVVAIFLVKMLCDIGSWEGEPFDSETYLSGMFTPENAATLHGLRIGLVVPQQSLRKSIQAVFARTPGLTADMVVSPFDVGKSARPWDLLVVDETHRLNQRANQTSAQKNREFAEINVKLFGSDGPEHTQLDWIKEQSHQQVLLVDVKQRVRPADLDASMLASVCSESLSQGRLHRLTSQMRVRAGEDYVDYVRRILSPAPPKQAIDFGDYDVRFFDDVGQMTRAIKARNADEGLARLLAGYAWSWESKNDSLRMDIVFPDIELRWNSRVVDWVDSPKSVDEVGSIHTIQGYDLNYAGVIIGRDLRYDPVSASLKFDREHYYDKKGKQNNPGQKLTDDDLLEYVQNIYSVLLTRGIRGTYLHVVDEQLREYLRPYFAGGPARLIAQRR